VPVGWSAPWIALMDRPTRQAIYVLHDVPERNGSQNRYGLCRTERPVAAIECQSWPVTLVTVAVIYGYRYDGHT
jgi:hypothetical protein